LPHIDDKLQVTHCILYSAQLLPCVHVTFVHAVLALPVLCAVLLAVNHWSCLRYLSCIEYFQGAAACFQMLSA